MSHLKERKEKNCLNCNADIYGRFCHVCGQENLETKETAWHLVTHFVYDITHFDGKFFSTVKYLLTKPGFLSLEYSRGRRMSYLNPIKMYVFTSALFFIFFFSFVATGDVMKVTKSKRTYSYEKVVKEIAEKRKNIEERLQNKYVPANIKPLLQNSLLQLNADTARLRIDTTNLEELNIYKSDFEEDFSKEKYTSVKAYDSIQQKLPGKERDGWLGRHIRHKKIELFKKYGNDIRAILEAFLLKFIHSFPQILFVSLPIFALLLKMLYIRRKQYYYADHGIYTVHLYCAMFIMIFVGILISKLRHYPYFGWVGFLSFLLFLYILWYIYKSMRVFYMQSRAKTIFKYVLVMFISFFVMSMLSLIFMIFSVYTI